jgi:hypothetical protein
MFRKERIRLDGIYRLPLYMTGDEKDATDELRESPQWPRAEMEIMDLIQQLHIRYGIVNDPVVHEVQGARQASKRLEIISEKPEANQCQEAAIDAAHLREAPGEKKDYGDALA